jgi:hypothetical protein
VPNPSGPASRRVTGCRRAAIQRVASCVLRMRRELCSGRRSSYSRTLTPLSWPDAPVGVAEPGLTTFIQASPDVRIRCRCHLIVYFTRTSTRKIVELRGFEPLTSCMPYRPGPSPDKARHRLAWPLPAVTVAERGPAWLGTWRRWLPTWLPVSSLAALMFDDRTASPPPITRVPYRDTGTSRRQRHADGPGRRRR